MINFIIWLIVGGIIGWLASIVMKCDAQQGIFLNIIVGIVGAFLGGLVAGWLGFGGADINDGNLSIQSLIVSFIGAVVLLLIVNMFTRGRAR